MRFINVLLTYLLTYLLSICWVTNSVQCLLLIACCLCRLNVAVCQLYLRVSNLCINYYVWLGTAHPNEIPLEWNPVYIPIGLSPFVCMGLRLGFVSDLNLLVLLRFHFYEFECGYRVATHLENLEKSGNSKVVREKSGKMEKVRETEICFSMQLT